MNAYANTLVARGDDGIEFFVDVDAVYTTAGDGYWSDVSKAVTVTGMGIYVGKDEDEGDGDFYVCYDEATWDMDTDGLIYTDSAFLAEVQNKMREVLLQMGVDNKTATTLADSISYSEQGMQDYGRVSCDAFELADFLRNFYNTVVA